MFLAKLHNLQMASDPLPISVLNQLLVDNRTATLGTHDPDGHIHLSMVPFAIDTKNRCMVLHVSQLAPHTSFLLQDPEVALLITQAALATQSVHDLPRIALQAKAMAVQVESEKWLSARATYLARFPEAAPMTTFTDFRFVTVKAHAARLVAGFGAAQALDISVFEAALGSVGN